MVLATRNVLVTVPFFDDESRIFLEYSGCTVTTVGTPDGNTSPETLLELLHDKHAWIVGHARVTRELMHARPSLAVIARRGVGYERVDVAAARDLGRVVTIAAGGNAPSVADHTVGLMLATGRRFHESRVLMNAGDWSIQVGTELFRKTIGLMGFGRISRLVAQRLAGFEARVIAHDPRASQDQASAHGVCLVDFQTLLRESDYLSLHVPLTPSTRSIIDAAAIAAMKSSAIVINTSRGGLVEEKALFLALQNNRLRGAALDVFEFENDPDRRQYADLLLGLPNFTTTPHAAGSTEEALKRSNLLASQSIVDVLNGGAPPPDCIVVDGRIPSRE